MNFATSTFLLFLPTIFAIYWLLKRRVPQNIALIAASYIFYAWWDWRFCFLMIASTLVDFGIGLVLGRTNQTTWRRLVLVTSLVCNLSLLGTLKYFGFFADNLQALLSGLGIQLHATTYSIVLPIGISFYTFQTLSYTIDVYRRRLEPTHNLIDYLAFVSFFPQLVAGPIERASQLLPQFSLPRTFDSQAARDGCRLILWGLAKKIILADRLALVVDSVYGQPGDVNGPVLMFATVCFAFQIYCDFSAYSEIAKGVAHLFGIRLMRNFAYPYFSQSLGEFWRRWHISLSTWFRDYVYIPLGGSKLSATRTRFNLFTTFLISGFWHGAAWNFLAWGAINGMFVSGRKRCVPEVPRPNSIAITPPTQAPTSAPSKSEPSRPQLLPGPRELARMALTFSIVCLGWVFFRAESVAEGFHILNQMVSDLFNLQAYAELVEIIDDKKVFKRSAALICGLVAVEWVQRHKLCPLDFSPRTPTVVRWAVYTMLVWITLYLVPPNSNQSFIYFEF